MSWPVVCFALVAGVLLAGWLAYERARPSARTVALVATLSALAALGRDAFAAVDEVKPITAMAFVIGYGLGPLPGFVVGAVGMLASNMLLGQGPYTPWQMAAWGIVGLLGAAAGKLSRNRLSRLPLAVGCALAAAVAKEIMNLYTWTLGANHTPAAFLANAGVALPFDAVDVISTLLFGLAFGPELVRLLQRARARSAIHWERAGAAGASVLALLLCAAAVAPAAHASVSGAHPSAPAARSAASSGRAISRALSYLLSAQRADGGFGASPQSASTGMYTAWAAIGLAAGGRAPLSVRRAGRTVLDVLKAQAPSLSGAGDIERTMLALHACGVSADRLAGRDLLAALLVFRQPDGSFEGQVNITAFAILALRAAGRGPSDPVLAGAGRWLARQQNGDGGFSFGARGAQSDVDDTGAAMQGLAAAGIDSPAEIARAVLYLRDAQSSGGGFPQQAGGEANAQSTAWAIQGLAAAGRLRAFAGRRSPLAYLRSLVAPDGSVRYSKGMTQTPVWVTSQALAALAEKPFPIGRPRSGGAADGSGVARRRSAASKSEGISRAAGGSARRRANATPSSTSSASSTTSTSSTTHSTAPSANATRSAASSGEAPARSPGGVSAPASASVAVRAEAGAEAIAARCLSAISGLLGG